MIGNSDIIRSYFSALSSSHRASIAQVGGFFSKLNQVYKDYIEAESYYTNVNRYDLGFLWRETLGLVLIVKIDAFPKYGNLKNILFYLFVINIRLSKKAFDNDWLMVIERISEQITTAYRNSIVNLKLLIKVLQYFVWINAHG